MAYGAPRQISSEPDEERNLMDPVVEAEVKDNEK
jgi:hypothetical protein